MSGPVSLAESGMSETVGEILLRECLGHECELYITVYTTEHHQVSGCAKALEPQMAGGLLRV